MNDTLKVAGRIGAELGAAKAENDRLRGLLREAAKFIDTGDMRGLNMIEVHAALSQQPEPTDTYAAVDMATAAAQGFRDGQAAVEPAPAQDEQSAVVQFGIKVEKLLCSKLGIEWTPTGISIENLIDRLAARPAQPEQQPVSWQFYQDGKWWNGGDRIKDHRKNTEAAGIPVRDLYAAPVEQTAPLKPHQLRELVNDLRDVARKYHATEQLREQIAHTLRAAMSAQGAAHG